jgi:hypothetical protein
MVQFSYFNLLEGSHINTAVILVLWVPSNNLLNLHFTGARRSVVGWGTMLQAGRSRVRVPMRWIFFNLSFHPHYGPGFDPASNRNEYQEPSWGGGGGKGRPARKADNLTAICEPIV